VTTNSVAPSESADRTVRAQLAALDAAHCRLARTDANAFATYVLKDEETGGPILTNADQREWHTLFDQHPRLLIWSHTESGKTSLMSIGRVLFELGRNPNLRVCIVSNTDGQAQKICLAVQKYIEQSEELHRVFPELRRAPDMPWNAHHLFVERATQAKDPSVQTCGIHGNILGARIDLLILDDLLDYENTASPTQRNDLWGWYHSTLEGRLTQRSRVLCIGTAWHREDFMHRLAQSAAWVFRRYSVVDPETGQSRWPARWPSSRIEARRIALGPLEFSRQLLCVARSDADARFKKEWVDQCLRRGLGVPLIYALRQVPSGYKTYTGVDLGVRVKQGSDLTALCTVIIAPNGDRRVLDLEAGRWVGPEIVAKIEEKHHRYQSIVFVEDNAAQQFIVQFTKHKSAVPVHPFTTDGKKLHPEFGIEGLATEMANGKWIIPSVEAGGHLVAAHPELDAWVNELLYYDPRGHAGDRLMASWIVREGARRTLPKVKFGRQNLTAR